MMTFRPRQQLPGPWIRIPTESQKFWHVAFATDTDALGAQVGVVVTRSVSRFDIISDWEGTSTHGMEPCKGYDPERIYDSQTGTTFRLDGLSYGPWVGDPLQLDRYGSLKSRAMLQSCCVTFLLEWQSMHRKGTFTGNIIPNWLE
jgi:hypothetical protein